LKNTDILSKIEDIENALRVLLVPAVPGEYDLHALVRCALEKGGIPFVHEASIAPRSRIDFLSDNIGIEIKKGKPQKSLLLSQISKYLSSDKLDAIIVVTQKSVSLPRSYLNKPIRQLPLDKLWGVSLP